MLCSDLLEVQGGYAKKPVDKISLSIHAMQPEKLRFQFAIGCAGSGPYMDMLQDELKSALESLATSSVELPLVELPTIIRDTLADVLVSFYGKHIWPRSANAANSEMQFLLAVQPCPFGEQYLMKIMETAVNLIDDSSYACIGIGSYLAEYIFEQLLSGPGVKEYQLALAAYVLSEVNDNVDGCGLGYSIYHLSENGRLDWASDLYGKEDFSSIKHIFKYAFQTVTDVTGHPELFFEPERIGELIREEKERRLKKFDDQEAYKAHFAKRSSDE